jgi:hypothetical protein
MITNDTKCKRKIKFSLAVAKPAFNRKETLSTSKMHLRKKLVKCYIWSIAFYGA